MDGPRQEYPALLRSIPPSQAVSILDDRVKLIGRINHDIADWLAERRRVEDAYVQGLRKLASRGPREVPIEMGVFRSPWQSILNSMEVLANAHHNLAQRIESDVEKPLKNFQSQNREMQAVNTIQGNLAAIAKDVDNAQRKASKLSGGKSANKIANATSDVEAANQMWESQAPYVFEQLQALDESRVNHLRDVLTQLETHEADQVEKSRATAETCLNTILNINTAEEISAFVARQTANATTIPALETSRNRAGSSADRRGQLSELPAPVSTPSRPSAARPSESSPFSTSSKMAPPPPPSSRKGFGGLRRLGTVLTRDKGTKGGDRPPSPDKRSRTGRNPLRRGHSSRQDMQQLDSPPQTSASNISSQPPQLGDPLAPSGPTVSSSPPPPLPQTSTEGGRGPTFLPTRQSSVPLTNGFNTNTNTSTGLNTQERSQNLEQLQPQRDTEGFSAPPPAVDAITQAQQEAAAVDDVDAAALKLNIRDAPIKDGDEAEQQSAISNVASTLREQAAPVRRSTTRGRRDVRNTIFVPSGQSLDSVGLGGSPAPSVPLQASAGSPLSSDGNRGSDAQSVRSAYSLSSNVNTAVAHPQMHQPGLNASIVETVSATFQHGQANKVVVIGELALQYNPPEDAAAPSTDNVRLENFHVLEKVAPNPAFVTQKPSASGEYSINLSHPTRPAVAFKYQLHVDETDLGTHAPISLTPQWKIEAKQASVILQYAINPAVATLIQSNVQPTLTLKNLMIFINVEGTKASSCQSKPAGIFSKEKSLIYWKLNEVTLGGSAAAPQRLLARFSTESEAQPGNVEARWEVSGEDTLSLGSGLAISQSGGKEASTANDPFADENGSGGQSKKWEEVPVTRKVVSGKYVAS